MFAVLEGATIKDIAFEDVLIDNPGGEEYSNEDGAVIGTLAGVVNKSATIDNVDVLSGTINTQARAGGLVGAAVHSEASECDGIITIKNCENYADIEAATYGTAGGIVGYVQDECAKINLTIKNCKNYGDLAGTWAAGIVARHEQTEETILESNENYGSIFGVRNAGGIAGEVKNINFKANKNFGNVSCELFIQLNSSGAVTRTHSKVGGIVSEALTGCSFTSTNYNYGNISSKADKHDAVDEIWQLVAVGGAIGFVNGADVVVTNVASIKNPNNVNAVAPIVSYTKATENGTAISSELAGVGELVGRVMNGTIDASNPETFKKDNASKYSIGVVEGKTYVAGEKGNVVKGTGAASDDTLIHTILGN